MKFYQVIYKGYYDDCSSGGECIEGSWFFLSQENAKDKVAEIKPLIYEKYKDMIADGEEIDTPECYAIREDGSACYWGSMVSITEVETVD